MKKLIIIALLVSLLSACTTSPSESPSAPPSASPSTLPSEAPTETLTPSMPASVEKPVRMPQATGDTLGLEGADKVLYTLFVNPSGMYAESGDLLIPTLLVAETYPSEDGNTNYICAFATYQYSDIGYRTDNWEEPAYVPPAEIDYTNENQRLDLMWFFVTLETLKNGNQVCKNCFALDIRKKNILKAVLDPALYDYLVFGGELPVKPREVTPFDSQKLLDRYIECNFGVTPTRHILPAPTETQMVSSEPTVNTADSVDILDKIYLGMPRSDVYSLFGEPDYQASGLMWFGYNDIGIFDVAGSFADGRSDIITRFNDWDLYELINTAMNRYDTSGENEYFAQSYLIRDIVANPNSFTVYFVSLCETFTSNGESDVRRVLDRDLPLGIGLSFEKNANGDYTLTAEYKVYWDIPSIQMLIDKLKKWNYSNAMYHFVGVLPNSTRLGFRRGGTVAITDYAESLVLNEGEFLIKYFPGATLSVEKYDEEHALYPSDSSWVIEYVDSSKNITVGRDGMGAIPITDDLIGIRCADEGKYEVRFEKYKKAE